MSEEVDAPSRRAVLAAGGAVLLAVVLAPQMAQADIAAVEAELRRLFGDRPMDESKIKLDIPQIAENGLVVPLSVEVESPMTVDDYVKAVHLFADGNPAPSVASFYFTPANGKAVASSRMRLAKSQSVIAVAEMSNGALHMTRSQVKVTIGGCGG
jgi:sulfur-oxidizing protein SoxY